jgi:hypothetical protein
MTASQVDHDINGGPHLLLQVVQLLHAWCVEECRDGAVARLPQLAEEAVALCQNEHVPKRRRTVGSMLGHGCSSVTQTGWIPGHRTSTSRRRPRSCSKYTCRVALRCRMFRGLTEAIRMIAGSTGRPGFLCRRRQGEPRRSTPGR